MVGNDPPANGAVASALTYLAPLFLVFLVIVANNEHAMKFYDTCASELQMERTQFLLLISTVATLFLASWKLVVYYFQIQKEAMEKKIIYESERDALILIFESTGGPEGSWSDITRWCSDSPIETWNGIYLDPRSRRVNKIILANNGLVGSLPDDCFLALSRLAEIDLRDNKISGPLPQSILSLRRLEGLYLYENNFTGTIPLGIAKLKSLSGIFLFGNFFDNTEEARILFRENLHTDCYIYV